MTNIEINNQTQLLIDNRDSLKIIIEKSINEAVSNIRGIWNHVCDDLDDPNRTPRFIHTFVISKKYCL